MNSFIIKRNIERVLHFTTNIGLVGILNTDCVKSRKGLDEDEYLSHILHKNCKYRKDPKWIDYISMSIQEPNKMFFNYASQWEHNRMFWWCVLAFSPDILAHPNVIFSTTNNAYDETKRGKELIGLQALYAPTVSEKHPYLKKRFPHMSKALPTSPQAEVLYPKKLDLKYLTNIYLPSIETETELLAYLAGAKRDNITHTIDEGFFK